MSDILFVCMALLYFLVREGTGEWTQLTLDGLVILVLVMTVVRHVKKK
jgi:hypothetical protein